MNNIRLIGDAPISDKYQTGTFEEFEKWASRQVEFQLDIETDVTDYWCTRKLITIQFGEVNLDQDVIKTQWVLQWSRLTQEQQNAVKAICEDNRCKLVHNAAYEVIVLRFHGMTIPNVHCTMLGEKIINGGIADVGYSLADIYYRYFSTELDKSEQTTFGDDILTENKVVYAATDVQRLDEIRAIQARDIEKWSLQEVLALENEVLLSFCDITYYGMEIDPEKWKACEEIAEPLVADALSNLNAWLRTEEFQETALTLGVISPEDRILINFNAPLQKRELLELLYPTIPGATKPIITKFIRDNPTFDMEDLLLLTDLKDGDYAGFSNKLVRDHRDYLIQHEYLLPAFTPAINWNSVQQALPVLQAVHPKLTDLSEESVAKTTHPIFQDLSNYKESLKLISTYGMKFLEKHLEPDGMVRTSFNQVLVTGRVSSSRPNMQNIPAKESPMTVVQPWLDADPSRTYDDFTTRYRNAFICKPGEVFVDSDYKSQELAIIAHISKDPVWFKAIQEGKDLHSVCAQLVYGKIWLDAAEPDCKYYKKMVDGIAQDKCKCPKHKTLRTSVKTINFGLAYGMSEFKLAGDMGTTVREAKALIDQYFFTFPAIGKVLTFLGNFGVKNGYIQTLAPYKRKRWFPFWKFAKSRIDDHISDRKYDPSLGEIERASKNHPIQGAAADMMKLAMVKVRRHICANNLQDMIRMTAQVHDQLTTICKNEKIALEWQPKFDSLMEEAADAILPSKILKADTQLTPYWTK